MTTIATEAIAEADGAPASEEWLKLGLAIDDYPPLAETLRRQAALSDSRPIQAAIAAAEARKERAEAARTQFDLDAAVGVASSAGDTRANEAVIVDADLEIQDLRRTLAVRRSALDVLSVAIGRYRSEAITAYFASNSHQRWWSTAKP